MSSKLHIGKPIKNIAKKHGYSVSLNSNRRALLDVALATKVGSSNNRGPILIVDSPMWFTGDAKYCMSENTYQRTDILCD